MLSLIGSPRGTYGKDCRMPTNQRVLSMMETADFGPFKATGLRPAVAALKRIMADIRAEKPEIHDTMGTAGMLCCRLVRGSSTAISNHSWGTAIDLTLDGKLDPRGDGRTQVGLREIHPIFNRHGFYWGAAFGTEDAMHFEASDALIVQWSKDGEFGAVPAGIDLGVQNIGDRGPEVEEIQTLLNLSLGIDIDSDGVFGKDTRSAVLEFQRLNGLTVDGVVGPKTMDALRKVTV